MSESEIQKLLWTSDDNERLVEYECEWIDNRVFAVSFAERDCWRVHALASF